HRHGEHPADALAKRSALVVDGHHDREWHKQCSRRTGSIVYPGTRPALHVAVHTIGRKRGQADCDIFYAAGKARGTVYAFAAMHYDLLAWLDIQQVVLVLSSQSAMQD